VGLENTEKKSFSSAQKRRLHPPSGVGRGGGESWTKEDGEETAANSCDGNGTEREKGGKGKKSAPNKTVST